MTNDTPSDHASDQPDDWRRKIAADIAADSAGRQPAGDELPPPIRRALADARAECTRIRDKSRAAARINAVAGNLLVAHLEGRRLDDTPANSIIATVVTDLTVLLHGLESLEGPKRD